MELHDDDKPVGRILTRREMLALLGGSGTALALGFTVPNLLKAQGTDATPTATTTLPSCVVKPDLTEGPYFVDDQLDRIDIRVDPSDGTIKEGLPLLLEYRVQDVTGGNCAPLEGAQVDVWHCDADGVYSGVTDPGFDTTEQLWLRGYQVTDEDGIAKFLTIVPGWYSGRAVHIHFKIRTEGTDGESYEFTSQLFFDPEQIEEIYADEPYVERGLPNTPNDRDGIFQGSEGLLTLALTPLEEADMEDLAEELEAELDFETGTKAIFDIGLDLSDTSVGASDSAGGGGPGGPGGGNPPGNRG